MKILREMPGEVRAIDEGRILEGYTAVFDQWTDIGGMFREKIAPGAFSDMAEYDTVALFNHDPNNILGRLNAGTLRINEDEKGLRFEVDVDEADDIGQRVMRKVERGELWGNSFAFTIDGQEWDEDDDGNLSRTITRIGTLYDVGPVTYPAYEQTDVALRAADEMLEAAEDIARLALMSLPPDRGQQDAALRCAARLRAISLAR